MTYTDDKYCPLVKYDDPRSDLSVSNLRSTGADWIAIIVTNFQENINTTQMFTTNVTATDDALVHVINYAHSVGLKVMLKPHIDLTEDPTHWRGDIGTFFNETQWEEWFQSYTTFILHYAEIAEKLNVELFSLFCELIGTTPRANDWREIASNVRDIYSGNLTMSANWGGQETNITYWDIVDIIGVDAYYPLAPNVTNPTLDDLVEFWQLIMYKGVNNGVNGGYMSRSLHNLSLTYNKPIVFTEIGYCSGNCTTGPQVDLEFQLLHFQSLFSAFESIDWFKGAFWWNWLSDPTGGIGQWCMTPQFKPTEVLLREQYGGTYNSTMPNYPPICPCIL
eukprot:gene2023-2490_t